MIAILTFAFQFPRTGDIHIAAGLPILSAIAGIILMGIWQERPRAVYAGGLSVALLFGIAFNVLTSYIPTPAGFGDIIGIGELRPVANWLINHSNSTDTLYVLPASDSDSQLHILANMLPPKTWMILNEYTLTYQSLQMQLLAEWSQNPPIWVIYFPTLVAQSFPPSAQPIVDFVKGHYTARQTLPQLPFYGDAVIYQLNADR